MRHEKPAQRVILRGTLPVVDDKRNLPFRCTVPWSWSPAKPVPLTPPLRPAQQRTHCLWPPGLDSWNLVTHSGPELEEIPYTYTRGTPCLVKRNPPACSAQ